ncbi:hypothetical protein DY000_02034188 [Brassica cretica]|uniref:DUF287 domain-containing protein n=1 Tax=Brassica cretica TaxID=69181 RepID=A0ABQ7DVK4_BRACR|nr:hypothetical protein DY000_02034188 [Brassica cretica]
MDKGTYEDLELIDDSDTPDIAADSWNKILLEPGSKIFWPDLFAMDEIISILEPHGYEADLLYEIMDEWTYEDLKLIDDSDTLDIAVDSWNKILLEPGSKIFCPDLFEMDVRTREQQEQAGGGKEARQGARQEARQELRQGARQEARQGARQVVRV